MIDLSHMIQDMTTERTYERKNRFNGESVMLTKEEARRHDCIFLAELMATLEDKNLAQAVLNSGIQCESIWIGLDSTMLRHTWSYWTSLSYPWR